MKELEENIALSSIEGMGEVTLPTATQVGSGDVPANSGDAEEEYKKKKKKMKKLLTFESYVNEAKFDKKKLMKAMKMDDGIIQLANGDEFIIYNPDNGNDENTAMWNDKVIFALDQDGEEHEVKYSDIVSYNESAINERDIVTLGKLDDASMVHKILKDEMIKNKISRTRSGDGEVTVYTNDIPNLKKLMDDLGISYELHESLVNEAKAVKVTKKEWPYVEFKIGSKKHKVEFDYEDIIDNHGNEGQDQYWLGKDDDGKEWSIDVYADYNGDVQDVHYDTIVAESLVNEAKFFRLPNKLNAMWELKNSVDYIVGKHDNGDDYKPEEMKTIEEFIKKIKQSAKAFKDAEDVKGTVYESVVTEAVSKATKIYQIATPAPKKILVEELENLFGDDYRHIVTEFDDNEGYESVLVFNLTNKDIQKIQNEIADVLIWEYSIKKGKEINESVVTEAFKFSKKEVEAAATLIASAISQADKVKAKVHDLEYVKGKGAGFEISIDGEKYDGGSYTVKDNGDVVNAAIGNKHPNAVYNTIGNKDIADVFINMEKYESLVSEAKFVKDFNKEVLDAKTKEEVTKIYPNAKFYVGKSDHFFGDLEDNLFFKAYYTKAQKEFKIKSVYSEKGSNYVHLYNESIVNEAATKSAGLVQFAADEKAEGKNAEIHLATFDGSGMEAQSTNKTWDDGVPVTKNFTRGGYKRVAPKGEVYIIESDDWWYFTYKAVWYAVKRKNYGTPPFEY